MSNNKQYSNIPLKDIFISENGDTDLKKEDVNGRGLPIITSGKSNFGILGKSDIVAKTFSANTITVDMFGYSAFRDHPYKMVTHARVFSLSRKDGKELSLGAGLYLTTAMSYFEQIFDYNNMCSWNKIQNLTVLLPVKEGEEIDYEYMEERIRELEEERIRELETYLNVSGLSTSILTEEDKSLLQKLKEGG